MICGWPDGCASPAAGRYTGAMYSALPVCLLHAQQFLAQGFGFFDAFEPMPAPVVRRAGESPMARRLGGHSP